jgi:hypothetical protein
VVALAALPARAQPTVLSSFNPVPPFSVPASGAGGYRGEVGAGHDVGAGRGDLMMRSVSTRPLLSSVTAVVLSSFASAQAIERISVAPGGVQGDGPSESPSISPDGRFVAFSSWATNLAAPDVNGYCDVFLRDRAAQTTTLVSLDPSGLQMQEDAILPFVSASGRYVAFGTLPSEEAFRRDLLSGTTLRVSPLNWGLGYRATGISGDGSRVSMFGSDWFGTTEARVVDATTGQSWTRIGSNPGPPNNSSFVGEPMLTRDGHYLFYSWLYVDGYGQGSHEATYRWDYASSASLAVEPIDATPLDSSADGRYVLLTEATQLWIRDVTTWMSWPLPLDGGAFPLLQVTSGALSDDGRYAAFVTASSNIVQGDTNGVSDAFVWDRLGHGVARVSVGPGGVQADAAVQRIDVSGDGAFLTFDGSASNLIAGDTNGESDVFVVTACLPHYADADGDGYGAGAPQLACLPAPAGLVLSSNDCDDADPARHPNAPELCNAIDDDCDGQIDEGIVLTYYPDADGDGYGNTSQPLATCSPPPGHVAIGGDCDDTVATIHPGAPETCNGLDDDCDGSIDEGLLATWYADGDSDGYGLSSTALVACNPPGGYVLVGGDCDDTNSSIHPGAGDPCNGIDDDCDGVADEGFEGDAYCTAGTTSHGCVPSISASGSLRAGATSGYVLQVSQLEAQKLGLVFYGFAPASAQWAPFSSSILCVAAPRQRMSASSSGGTAGSCDGALSIDARAWMAAHPGALGQPISAGQVLYFQGWFRDPPAPKGTNLSGGWSTGVCP